LKFDLILADPPWEYDNKQQNDPARGGVTYPTLSMEELAKVPVSNIAADNSLLVCWVTFPKLMDQYYEKYDPLSVIRAWGFRPLTALFVWVKTTKKGTIPDLDVDDLTEYSTFYSGLGRYTNSNAEIAIIARRGKMLERVSRSVKQLIVAPIGGHSEKPKEQYRRLDQLFGSKINRIELFARKQNPPPDGWHATGLDYDGVDIRDFCRGVNE
jgi:N6-adenosine-specific RNA methylase IME4